MESTYQRLRKGVMNGSPAPGAVVRAASLATDFDTKTEIVLAALQRLVGEGMGIETEDKETFRIAPLDRQRAIETVNVYQAIIASAASWALPNVAEDDLRELREHSSDLISALEAHDLGMAVDAYDDFLRLLLGEAHSTELDLVLRPIQTRFLRVLRLYLPLESDAGQFIEQHLVTIKFVEARDTTGLIMHFGSRLESFRRHIEASVDAPWEAASGG
jgi:DNA-binding GntR family transcriptional regulator